MDRANSPVPSTDGSRAGIRLTVSQSVSQPSSLHASEKLHLKHCETLLQQVCLQ